MKITGRCLTAGVAALMLISALGCAPPERDEHTLRLPTTEPILRIDPLYTNRPEWAAYVVYDALIGYDSNTNSPFPLLAKSWKLIDDRTFEFELRDDVRFHDGSIFDADDVVATVSYLVHPESIFPLKNLYDWIDRAEKLGPYRVRIVGKEPRAGYYQNLSGLSIFSSELFVPLENKADYGRYTPVGTGPYRVAQLDRRRGIILERNEKFRHGGGFKDPKIDRVHLAYVPERSTQLAMMLTGQLDLVKDLVPDQVALLMERAPHLRSTVSQGAIFAHIRFDSVNRAGNAALTDVRVRKALLMAINRPSLAENIVPNGRVMDAMCLDVQPDCAYTSKTPAYDPEGAAQLLDEAGYPNGFDLEITAVAETNAIATAVAADLSSVGVSARVQVIPGITFDDKFQRGDVQVSIHTNGIGNGAGAYIFWRSHFARAGNDYWEDELLIDTYRRGTVTVNDELRAEIYRAGFDHINDNYYMAPLVGIPTVFVHSEDITVTPDRLAVDGSYLYKIAWRD